MNHVKSPLVVTIYEQGGPSRAADVTGPGWRGYFGESETSGACGRCTLNGGAPVPGPVILVSDVDSTLIEEEVIDQLAALAGKGREVSDITAQAMAGEIDFATSLQRRVEALAGLPEEAFAHVAKGATIRPGTRELFSWVKDRGGVVAAVSGGFTPVVRTLAETLRLDHFQAIDLEVSSGRLTGRVAGPIVTAESKRTFVEQLASEYDLPTIVLGDGANDLLMLEAGDIGIGVHAKAVVREQIGNFLDSRGLDPVIGLLGHSLLPGRLPAH